MSGRVTIGDEVFETIAELSTTINPRIIGSGSASYPSSDTFSQGSVLTSIGEISTTSIDPLEAAHAFKAIERWYAYDESIQRYSALEGFATITAHCVLTSKDEAYVPDVLVKVYFYTRALMENAKHLRYSDRPEVLSEQDYTRDKINHLLSTVEDASVLFIDGPLIAGDAYTYFIQKLSEFKARSIFPVFIVKNSESNLVTEHQPDLRGKYHSDLHWVHSILQPGSHTNFFSYQDLVNKDNAKVFCYVKTTIGAVMRVEFPKSFIEGGLTRARSIVQAIDYLAIAHGDRKNPQVRPIAIAEQYAREVLRTQNFYALMAHSRLQPTMNQTRFS